MDCFSYRRYVVPYDQWVSVRLDNMILSRQKMQCLVDFEKAFWDRGRCEVIVGYTHTNVFRPVFNKTVAGIKELVQVELLRAVPFFFERFQTRQCRTDPSEV